MIAGDYFITPEAVHRFIERISPGLSYEAALVAIIRDLKYGRKSELKLTENKIATYIRVKGVYEFRAVIRTGEENKPAIVTICRSGKGKRRGKQIN